MPETVDCNLCGSRDERLLYRLRDYRLRVDDVEWNVVQCRSCGLGYLNPRPSPEEIARYYPVEYFQERERLGRRYELQTGYVPGKPGRLLDVGAARGDFLALMRDRGWEVAGIEPSDDAGSPYGLPIHRVRFPDGCDLASESFDVVTAWAVFEHLHDPAGAFRECARLLRPGGRLVIQVPNLRSIFGRYSLQEDVPRHLYFFSPRTLRRYGELAGLELDAVAHAPELFGGSGRGVLRLALVRALGGSTDEFFDVYRTPRRERFRRRPALTIAWTAAAAVEAVVLSDWAVRAARLSGQIVAQFVKSGSPLGGPLERRR